MTCHLNIWGVVVGVGRHNASPDEGRGKGKGSTEALGKNGGQEEVGNGNSQKGFKLQTE